MKTLKIATRKSPLALYQAEFVAKELKKHHKNLTIKLVKMTTKGDKILDVALNKIGGKNLFIKELEIGINNGRADIAVHSMKDMPFELPDNFEIGAILKRESPYDAFVANNYNSISELAANAIIGTSSLRRFIQIKKIKPNIIIKDLRGNVNTRLKKLDAGEFDAIILACAGLKRLELQDRIKEKLSPDFMLPAVGQGAIGIEIKKNDYVIKKLISPLIDKDTTLEVMAERAMNKKLQGSCQVPIAGFASINKNEINIKAMVGNIDKLKMITAEITGDKEDAEILGTKLADKLIAKNALELLKK